MRFPLVLGVGVVVFLTFFMEAAESFGSVEGYPYAVSDFPVYTAVEQTLEIKNGRVGKVLFPAPGAPALVTKEAHDLSIFVLCGSATVDRIEIGKQRDEKFVTFLTLFPQRSFPAGNGITRFSFTVPYQLPHGVYDLKVAVGFETLEVPNAVGFISDRRIAFTIWADPQIEDLQSKSNINLNWNDHSYPGFSDSMLDYSRQQGIIAIAMSQMNAMDTDFIACLGDIVFGINHQREYEDIVQFLDRAEIPLFAIPGNHDGYAKFVNENDLTTPLERDGLNYWRLFVGPAYHSFVLYGKTFLMLNTYDGTAERRASGNPIGIGNNAAAPVSNYGGFIGDRQMALITASFVAEEVWGLFSHHLPLGIVEKTYEYTAMEKYPQNKIIGALWGEEWNYESAAYDSDPSDTIFGETNRFNTGTRLVGAMAAETPRPPLYFSGHAHRDRVFHYEQGAEIIPGTALFVPAPMDFVQSNTAASSGETYWGIRQVYYDLDTGVTSFGYLCVDDTDCNPDKEGEKAGFPSIPLGNFWVTYTAGNATSLYIGGDGVSETAQAEVTNFLPTDETVRLRFLMPARLTGYRFDLEGWEMDDAMVTADRTAILITAKGEIAAGSPKEEFLQRQFTKSTALVTLGPDTVAAPEPVVEYADTILESEPLSFTVTNPENYFHLIWHRDGFPVSEGESFTEKFDYHPHETIELLHIAKNGAFGSRTFTVTV